MLYHLIYCYDFGAMLLLEMSLIVRKLTRIISINDFLWCTINSEMLSFFARPIKISHCQRLLHNSQQIQLKTVNRGKVFKVVRIFFLYFEYK